MPVYTFYPTLENGFSDSFIMEDLESDVDVTLRALEMLDKHRSAAFVVVYCGDRMVQTRRRTDPVLEAVLSKRPLGPDIG